MGKLKEPAWMNHLKKEKMKTKRKKKKTKVIQMQDKRNPVNFT